MTKSIALMLACVLALELTAFAGLGSDKTAYIGGTENQVKDGTEGQSSAKDEKIFLFEYKGGKIEIPYEQVNDLEYGQKAGRRLGLALTVSPWLLLSHNKETLSNDWLEGRSGQTACGGT